MKAKQWIRFGLAGLLLTLGCSGGDLTKSASPVALIVTNTQTLQHIDIAVGASNCNQTWGTILLQAIVKNPNNGSTGGTFNQVRISKYQVSYQRTDGGKLVPASYVRTMDALLTPGAAPSGGDFIVLAPDALVQAPFAALYPNNGGVDPDTNKPFVQMDIIVTVFGQTLAGEDVSGSTRFPITFCYACNGCS